MSKTRFIAGLTVLAIALSIVFYGSVKVINSFDESRVSKKQTKELKSVDAKTVLKSVNATDKLASSLNTDADKETSDNIVVQENKVQKLVLGQKNEVKSVMLNKTNKAQKTTIKTENKKSKNKNVVKKSKKKTKKKKKKYRSMGTYRITAYCPCGHCSSGTGITASGTRATEGRTIAADTSVLPMGTKVKINGHVYTVEDRGGAVNGRHIDMYYNSHSEALDWGVRYVEIFVLK